MELPDAGQLTLAAVLLTTGATAVAGLVTGIVFILSRVLPGVIPGHEAQAATLLAAALVVVALVNVVILGGTLGLELVFQGVVAWYAITRLAMSIYDDVTSKPASFRSQATP